MRMRKFSEVNIYRLVLCIGLIQIAAYWFAGSIVSDECTLAIPQPDTPLYYQAARRIVEGHPFSFSDGSAVCTGTTTVLYPFVLAIPYALGWAGDAIIVAGFLLNALFYLIFLLSWVKASDGWCDRYDARVLFALIIAMSGHCAFTTFSQTDIGFWLALSGLFAVALSQQRNLWVGIILALSPWVRPEGAILTISFALITAFFHFYRRDEVKTVARVAIVIAGAFSVCGVFALNYILTGSAQFASVAGKTHFATLPFASAVMSSVSDLFSIVKCTILGLSAGTPRDLLVMPLLGGFFIVIGVVAYRWSRNNLFGLMVLILASMGCILNIAQSGMQGANMERYLIWTFPLYTILTANGIVSIEDRLPRRIHKIPSVVIALFCLIGGLVCPCYFYQACSYVDSERLFAKDCDAIMQEGRSVGGLPCAPAYFFSRRRLANLSGVYSPEFAPQDVIENIERLRNKPNLRFDYWLSCSDLVSILEPGNVGKLGEVLLPGPCGMTLMKADWRAFDSVLPKTNCEGRLVARVDVGYAADESLAEYHVITRWGCPVFDPFVQFGRLGDEEIVDVGRVILGGDEMTVPLKPGCDVTVVARFWPRHSVVRSAGIASNVFDCSFSNPLKFNIAVDGNVVDIAEIPYSERGFSDVSFKIPGVAIRNPVSRIGFLGDHIVFGYWFYQ